MYIYLCIFFLQCLDDAHCSNICSWKKDQFIQCHGCWWPSIVRSQGIAGSHGIGIVILDAYVASSEYCYEWYWYLRTHISVFTCCNHNCQSHYMLHNQLWHHERCTIMMSSPEYKDWMRHVVDVWNLFLSSFIGLCCVRNKMKFVLPWWTVYALTQGLFRCLFPT